MLTGGRTAQSIYHYWSNQQDFPHDKIIYFLGDERCVALDNPESNFGMVCRSLFPNGTPDYVAIYPMMHSGSVDRCVLARQYEECLPSSIDVLMLSLGEDGHVASIFPGNPVSTEMNRLVIPVIGPKPPSERLTITPKVITTAETIFLLATGTEKGRVLSRITSETETPRDLPVMWAKDATWLLDEAAWQELNRNFL